MLDFISELANFMIGTDLLAVPYPERQEPTGYLAIDINSGDNERSEEVSLSALVNAKMRLEHLGIEHFFVADSRLLQDFRLEIKADEIFSFLTLHNYLRSFFVHGDR